MERSINTNGENGGAAAGSGSVERDLAEARQQLENIFDTMQAGILLVNPKGIITFANQRMAAMFGCPLEELIGSGYSEHVHPDQRDEGDTRMRRLIAGEIDHVHHERHYIRKNGRDFWGHLSGRRLEDDQGNLCSLVGVIADISEIKQVELALRGSEQKFSKAFSQAPLLMTISELETGRYLDVNDKFCEVSGFSFNEAVGRTSRELGWVSATERERLLGILKRDGRVQNLELQLTAKGGREIICLYSAEIIDVNGTERLLSIAQDITQSKNDREALAYANECFQQALDSSQHILYRLNVKKGCYDYISPLFERITGYPLAMFLKNSFEMLFGYLHPDDRQRIFGQLDEAFRTRTGAAVSFDLEYRFRKADGGYCWFHDTNTACFDDQGQLECFFGSVHDITDRKQAEELLKESEERYRRLVEQSSAWIWKTDAALRHTYSNENVEKLLGYTLREFYALDVLTLVHPDDHAALNKVAREAAEQGRGWSGVVLRWQRRDGSWRSIESSGGPIFDEKGDFLGLQGIDTDITDKLLLRQEQEKNQRLESLGLLAGGIAHDFNNILTGIVGNLSLARMMINDDHRAAGRLEECEKAAKRASELTQQLLTFARGGEPVKKSVDLARLIREAASFALRGSHVKELLELPEGLWNIDADEGQINQTLNNLLINAMQAMPDGGTVTIRAENRTADNLAQALGRHVRLIVRDTGSGIAPDQLNKIFDPYFTTKQSGSGLGLASVYSIVTRHGGTVTVSSQLGNGAEFVLCLPAAGESAASKAEQGEVRAAAIPPDCRVLVMDDEELIRDVAGMMLTELGCLPELCGEGGAALELYRQALERGTPYDLVILDLTVPGGMGGLEAARRIREIDPDARLLVSSGYSNDAVTVDLKRYGFCGAIMKPYTLKNLADELGRVLGGETQLLPHGAS